MQYNNKSLLQADKNRGYAWLEDKIGDGKFGIELQASFILCASFKFLHKMKDHC